MTDDTGAYLIWSHEKGAWWGPGQNGYVRQIHRAGRYSRTEAIAVCTRAIPGTADEIGALPELPVRLDDVLEMLRNPIGGPGSPGMARWL